MRTINTLALAATLLFPLAAAAADLTVELEGQVEYDDNALRLSGEEEDDVLFRIRPLVKLHEDRGQDVIWAISYAVPFEFAVENGDELDDIDHIARGSATYRVNERLDFYVRDDFRYLRNALREVVVEDVLAGEGTFLINQERDRVTLNDAEIGAKYRFTPRLSGEANVAHELFDTERDDRADNWLLRGAGELNYVVTPKHTVGIGVRYFHQQFDDRESIPGSTVNSYNGFLQWVYRISETLQFSIAAGPTYIDSEQDDPAASVNAAAIPFVSLAGGTNVTGLGLVDVTGAPAAGTANPGSIVVSQLASCPTLIGSGIQVFQGAVCPIPNAASATPATAGVFLDGVNDAAAVAAATTTTPQVDPFATGESDSQLEIFGTAVIRKDWSENFHSALRYERTQGGASGLGGAVVRDAVNFSNDWDFAERWRLNVRADWILRQSVIDNGVSQFLVAGDGDPGNAFFTGTTPAGATGLATIQGGDTNKIDTMRYGVAGRLTHRFTRNTSGWIQLTYNEQTSKSDTLGDPSDFQNFLAVLGVRHVFEPIKLW